MTTDRKDQIRNYLFEHGLTQVTAIAEVLQTSLATIRRDLTEMERAGLIERLHGAARIAETARGEVAFDARESSNLLAKRAIASEAARLVRPGSTIFLDAGTTVLQLARMVKLMKASLTVFTNSIVVARELADAPGITVNLLGGRVRADNLSVVGPFAESMLNNLWFDQVFLGASAISDDGVISGYDMAEANLNAQMLTRADQVLVLADRSKFSNRATYTVAQLNPAHRLIVDTSLPDALRQTAKDLRLDVVVAQPGAGPSRDV